MGAAERDDQTSKVVISLDSLLLNTSTLLNKLQPPLHQQQPLQHHLLQQQEPLSHQLLRTTGHSTLVTPNRSIQSAPQQRSTPHQVVTVQSALDNNNMNENN